MSSIQVANTITNTIAGKDAATDEHNPAAQHVRLFAVSAALGVAPLYYAQPLLALIGADFAAAPRAVGLVPTLTQIGYALGILLLAPLGDRFDRHRVIMIKAALLTTALLIAATAPTLNVLLAASLAIGMTATIAQDVVAATAVLASASARGKTVGTVMTGLLSGILLSRVGSGLFAQYAGWRPTFALAAISIAAIGLALWRGMPRLAPTTRLPYAALLASLGALWWQHSILRRAALAQGLLAVGFSAFWSTLAVMLHGAPFHLGSAAAGAFGLAGAAGAVAAPVAGRMADRHGTELVVRIGAGISALSFAVLALAAAMQADMPLTMQLIVIALATVGFDLGVQMAMIAHQSAVYGIDPGARSRLNAVFFVHIFVGMALGSAAGSMLLARYGWVAVALLATASALSALAVRLWPHTTSRN